MSNFLPFAHTCFFLGGGEFKSQNWGVWKISKNLNFVYHCVSYPFTNLVGFYFSWAVNILLYVKRAIWYLNINRGKVSSWGQNGTVKNEVEQNGTIDFLICALKPNSYIQTKNDYHSMLTVHRPLLTVLCSTFSAHRSLLTVLCSPFSAHCSLLTVRCSLFTVDFYIWALKPNSYIEA